MQAWAGAVERAFQTKLTYGMICYSSKYRQHKHRNRGFKLS